MISFRLCISVRIKLNHDSLKVKQSDNNGAGWNSPPSALWFLDSALPHSSTSSSSFLWLSEAPPVVGTRDHLFKPFYVLLEKGFWICAAGGGFSHKQSVINTKNLFKRFSFSLNTNSKNSNIFHYNYDKSYEDKFKIRLYSLFWAVR